MKKLFSQLAFPLIFASALACAGCHSSSATTPSASSEPVSLSRGGTYMVCYADSHAHGIKVSSVFRLPSVDQVTMLEEPWAKDFRRYVGQSGDFGAISVTCTQVDPRNPDAALKSKIDAWHKQGIPVVRVNWKYAG